MSENMVVFDNVSKFYGDVLGVNRINLAIAPGITGLVGPNGSGKSTLMNLMTGLLRPTQGSVKVLGFTAENPEALFRRVGYATQFDSFPAGLTGFQFVESFLRVHGFTRPRAAELAGEAIAAVNLSKDSGRRVSTYSKGMRQRIRLAQAIAHRPQVLVLDEPLNGLDPMARAEVIALFQKLAGEGKHVIVSSHILHEVDLISDRVILLNSGYIAAEGEIEGVRTELHEHPIQVFVRTDRPSVLAARLFGAPHVVEVRVHEDGGGISARTRDADQFHLLINRIVLEEGLRVEALGPADDDVQAVYDYLIGGDGGRS